MPRVLALSMFLVWDSHLSPSKSWDCVISLCKNKILASKKSKFLNELKNYNLISIFIVNVIVVVKVFDNNQ